ncbi:MAG: phospholipase [Acidobacteriales bacterium]|nr:phospholipase [Terriglobales bacterium]
MSRYLVVLPDDTAAPLLAAIHGSKSSLRIKMFNFSDPHLENAVIEAHRRGVKVRVMLNPARRSGVKENEDTCKRLLATGIEVLDSNPAFDVTHEKSMVVDDNSAWIMSLNWDTKNLTGTRDYAVVTSHAHEVGEVIECFEADWSRQKFEVGKHSHLIWCVGNARHKIAEFIDQTKHSLWVQNERYQDPQIIEHIVRAGCRGVKVHVMARPPHGLKTSKLNESVGSLRMLDDVGVKVHKVHGLKLHGKLFFADGVRAIIGSINLAPGSFDSRRELAIEVRDQDVLQRLHDVLHTDWTNSRPMDLSDAGLLADLGDDRASDIVC